RLVVGTPAEIKWNITGKDLAAVAIRYSTDDGRTYPHVITPTTEAAKGAFTWEGVPDILGDAVRVRVIDAADSLVFAESEPFSVIGSLEVTSPVLGDSWPVGSQQDITWQMRGSIDKVKIYYAADKRGYIPIATVKASEGAYTWTVPDSVSNKALITVTDAWREAEVFDTSDTFYISADFSLTGPAEGEVLVVGDEYPVRWKKLGSAAKTVDLEFSSDGGKEFRTIARKIPNSESYLWQVPDHISAHCKLRIFDSANPYARKSSPGLFKIRGALQLTAPNGGESWTVGERRDITWQSKGSIGYLELRLSTDNGTTYPYPVTPSVKASLRRFSWAVPDHIGSALQVKVARIDDPTAYDQSDKSFRIRGALRLTAPNGGEVLRVAESANIIWEPIGSIKEVDLTYSTDGGVSFAQKIASGADAAQGIFYWEVPDAIGDSLRVKVTDASDREVSDISDADFTVKGTLSLLSPNGGEVLFVADKVKVTWEGAGSIAKVRLAYSTDSGARFDNLIAAATDAALGHFVWLVPDDAGRHVRIKVTDSSDDQVYDSSNDDLSIKPRLELIVPNGGEEFRVGVLEKIEWGSVGTVEGVKLEYSLDEGKSYPYRIADRLEGRGGSHLWKIPDAISAGLKVRVASSDDPSVFDDSDGTFKIKGSLTLIAPNGGEIWTVKEAEKIVWTMIGSIAEVSLAYSTDNGRTYPGSIASELDAAQGNFDWTIPDAISTACRVKVWDSSDAFVFDASDADVAIRGALTLVTPNGGQTWKVASDEEITWKPTGSIDALCIVYSLDGGETFGGLVASNVPALTGRHIWRIPDAISQRARIRISDASNPAVFDTSDRDFTIAGILDITSPDGGEVWTVGSAHTITWGTTGSIKTVLLDLSPDAGLTFPHTISASIPNTGSFSWTVPDVISSRVRLRVRDAADLSVTSLSDNSFKIRGSLSVLAPDGGEVWTTGTQQNVAWDYQGSIDTVRLAYSTDGGFSYDKLIASSVEAKKRSYRWLIPESSSQVCRVSVSEVADLTVYDTSDGDFKIRGQLILSDPGEGLASWRVGSLRSIRWKVIGAVEEVRLSYSTDSGQTFPHLIIDSYEAAQGSYPWVVPDAIGPGVKIRIQDVSDPTIYDISGTAFAVKGGVELISPNGGEVWPVVSTKEITWATVGSIERVRLELSTAAGDDGYPYRIAAGLDAGEGRYSWRLPDTISRQAKIKISDDADPGVFDVSDRSFKIVGTLILRVPNGGEVFKVGSAQEIAWNAVGSLESVRITYSADGGTTYPHTIVDSAPAADSKFGWTIPDIITQKAMIKIADADDPETVSDTSNAGFKVRGDLRLITPNAGEIFKVRTTQTISWLRVGSISDVRLYYSTDSGRTYANLIATVDAGRQSYSWQVPEVPCLGVRLKILDASDPTVYDASDADLVIRGQLTLQSPRGGQDWVVGSRQDIVWDAMGTSSVVLEYSTDAGTSFRKIVGPIESSGSYAWTVPDTISAQCLVRVYDARDPAVHDISDTLFKIRGRLTLTGPAEGEAFDVGSLQEITWERQGSIDGVRLQFSTDGGETFPYRIAERHPAYTLRYLWTVPSAISRKVKVKISDADDAKVFALSPGNFAIKGAFALTAPNGGETFVAKGGGRITWQSQGGIGAVRLEYSVDAGQSFSVITDAVPNTGSFDWQVPEVASSRCRIRVSDASDASSFDISDADFAILGDLVLVAPNGGEVWTSGEAQPILWEVIAAVEDLRLAYSTDAGQSFPYSIAEDVAASGGSYVWTVPDTIGSSFKVKITDRSDPSISDTSDAVFTVKGKLGLTHPNGGQIWPVGSTQEITWKTNGAIKEVDLLLSTKAGDDAYPQRIASGIGASAGKYSWSVPDTLTKRARIKIADASDDAVFDTSGDSFKIVGGLTLSAPSAGEVFLVGSEQQIAWISTGSIDKVTITCSADGGESFPYTIVDATPAAKASFRWTIPDIITQRAKIKIADASDPMTVSDTSRGSFKIRGALDLVRPNGAEVLRIGTVQTIAWRRTGSIAAARLHYSTDSGRTYPYFIAAVDASRQEYSWQVPDDPSRLVRVKISDAFDSTVYDVSEEDVTIRGSLTMLSPNGGEALTVGAEEMIAWKSLGAIKSVALEYSIDNGRRWRRLTGPLVNTGTYTWTLPDAISAQCLVRVYDLNDPEVKDVSDSPCAIKGVIKLTGPEEGEAFEVGQTCPITWQRKGSVEAVRLQFSTDGGETFPHDIVRRHPGETLRYLWSVPSAVSRKVKIKISDAADPAVFDVSQGYMALKGAFTLTSPNGGEAFLAEGVQEIIWRTRGEVDQVRLQYSSDSGISYTTIVEALDNSGSYIWQIPEILSGQYRVRVSDAADSSAADESDADFAVYGYLGLTVPNGGESWTVGSIEQIRWGLTGAIEKVKIEYSLDGGKTFASTVADGLPALQKAYSWQIPDSPSRRVRIRISDSANPAVADYSDADLTIRGELTLRSPNGGETFRVGSESPISWDRLGSITAVALEYSIDNGANWKRLASSIPNSGVYPWTIPDSISAQCLVRIYDVVDPQVRDVSAAAFKIAGSLNLISPAGGDLFDAGSQCTIAWKRLGTITRVSLHYSTDSGATFPYSIVEGHPAAAGRFAWTIPNTISSKIKVRISDADDPEVFALSQGLFAIKGIIELSSPNGGESYPAKSFQEITWKTEGPVKEVDLAYSFDSGTSWQPVIANLANTGIYTWQIPAALSGQYRVSVSSSDDPSSFDHSDADFAVVGDLAVVSPNGKEVWQAQEEQQIRWKSRGDIANVRIEYSVDAAASFLPVALSAPNSGSYLWRLPDALTAQGLIKISDAANPDVFDISDAPFSVRGTLAIIAPLTSQTLAVSDTLLILWESKGAIKAVDLAYSIDNGATFAFPVAAKVANKGQYEWVVPDNVSDKVRIRIADAADPEVFAVSGVSLTIKAGFILTAPSGGEKWKVGSNHNITWKSIGTVSGVDLAYSRDRFKDDIRFIAKDILNTGIYSWTIPDAISDDVLVRISDAANPGIFSLSSGALSICPDFRLIAPNGRETWEVNTAQTIVWAWQGSVPQAKIEYSADGGLSFNRVAIVENIGSYTWVVPDDITRSLKVRVGDLANIESSDTSDNNAAIIGRLIIRSPNGGDVFSVADPCAISWSSIGTIEKVNLYYSQDQFMTAFEIAAGVVNRGSFNWTVPDEISQTVRVRVADSRSEFSRVSDDSDADFAIKGSLKVVSPNGGERWRLNQVRYITWTTTGDIGRVKIVYSIDDGLSFPYLVVDYLLNDDSYSWT
ncbi:Ser-Thr-rich GPI-anchored membrane family protein, partial [Candidatus Omnitrophota bacterium]